jgi:pimeloyl-ACP methyl ester carboxylesterase
VNERPVVFKNDGELNLVGIVHEPTEGNQKPIIVFNFGGVVGRVAEARQYVTLARLLCKDGFTVLRYDSRNMGDSEGHLPKCNTKSYYGTIQTGRYVSDVVSAIDFMCSEYGNRPVVLIGLCGGAITTLLAGAEDDRVSGMAVLSVPIAIDDPSIDYQQRSGMTWYWNALRPYLLKIRKPKYWKRLLTVKTNYKGLLTTLMGLGRTGWNKLRQAGAKASDYNSNTGQKKINGGANLNRYFFDAFETCALTHRKILFIFGGNDLFYWEFRDAFEKSYILNHPEYKDCYQLHVLPQANHMFCLPQWLEQVQAKTRAWVATI